MTNIEKDNNGKEKLQTLITTFTDELKDVVEKWRFWDTFKEYIRRESTNIIYNNFIFDFFIGITSLIFMLLTSSKLLFLVHGGVLAGVVVSALAANYNNRFLILQVIDFYYGADEKQIKKHELSLSITSIVVRILNVVILATFIYSLFLEWQIFQK